MHPDVPQLIALLGLQPHPEGGHFREIFRSAQAVAPPDGRGERSAITTIYYLLAAGQHSRWHRVSSDEVWHHYQGQPLELLWLDPSMQRLERRLLGPAGAEASPALVVPAACWQAARPLGSYTLAGCSVGPGFDFADFSMLSDDPVASAALRQRFPQLGWLIDAPAGRQDMVE